MKERIESEIAHNLKAATKITFLGGNEVAKRSAKPLQTLMSRRIGEFADIVNRRRR